MTPQMVDCGKNRAAGSHLFDDKKLLIRGAQLYRGRLRHGYFAKSCSIADLGHLKITHDVPKGVTGRERDGLIRWGRQGT